MRSHGRIGVCLERASGRMRRHGQPFFVGPGGLVDVRVNRWFCSDELRGLSRSTWRKYAYSRLVWLNFLSVYGVGWDEADAEAQEALKVWRVSDDRNPGAARPDVSPRLGGVAVVLCVGGG